MNDVVINKIQSIQRCVARAREEYLSDQNGFATNYTVQDATLMNIVRACEQTIDLANHVIKTRQMGVPTSSSESFDLLRERGVIKVEFAERLHKMVHFRNILIHHYQNLDLAIVRVVIDSGLRDLLDFGDCILDYLEIIPGESM